MGVLAVVIPTDVVLGACASCFGVEAFERLIASEDDDCDGNDGRGEAGKMGKERRDGW